MPSDHPEYSIIIPTYRRRAELSRCLAAIDALEFPRHRFEVIVVDDGSDTPPADLIAGLDSSLDAQLVRARHGGPAAARNAGAKLARGTYLIFTDDDCAPQTNWLMAIDDRMRGGTAPRAVGGRTVNVLASDVYATASQGIVDFLYAYYGNHSAPWRFFTSNNLAVPRTQFMEIGGFDESFPLAAAEDRDFCERWRAAGYDLEYAPAALVDHAHKLGFTSFNKQHFAYGRGAYDLHRSRARRGRRALRLEPARFYWGLISYPLRQGRGLRAVALSAIHFWSQVAYAAGYFFERARRGWAVDATERSDLTHADA